MHRAGVRPSVCPSVCLSVSSLLATARSMSTEQLHASGYYDCDATVMRLRDDNGSHFLTRDPRLTTTHESRLPTIAVSSQDH